MIKVTFAFLRDDRNSEVPLYVYPPVFNCVVHVLKMTHVIWQCETEIYLVK